MYERQLDGSGIITTTTAEGRRVRTIVDVLGHTTERAIIAADGFPVFAPVEASYDARGRLTTIRRTADGITRERRLHYTDADLPFAAPERGYPLAAQNGVGDLSRFEYNGLGQSTAVIAPDASRTEVGYDVNHRLSRIRPPGSADHIMTYDGHDALASYQPPTLPSGPTNTGYVPTAERGETDIINLPGGRNVDLTYDPVTGQLMSAQLSSLGTVSMTYLPSGQTDAITTPQHPALAGEPVTGPIAVSFQYDGPLVTRQQTSGLPGGAHSVQFGYDAGDEFNLTTLTVDAEAPITRAYDMDGVLTSAGPMSITPNADTGLPTTSNVGALTSTYGYNGFGEMDSAGHSWMGTSISGNLSYGYAYDNDGRLQQRIETDDSVTHSLDYQMDSHGRLTDVQQDGAARYHYEYDANGNRIGWDTPTGNCASGGVTPCAEHDAQDRLLRYGSITFEYNDMGQRIRKVDGAFVTEYEYDEAGNLWRVLLPDSTVVTYRVDGLGRRVGRFVDGVADAFWLYQDGLNPIAQLDGSGSVTQLYVYATNAFVPDVILSSDGRTLRVLTDQLGSVRRIIDTVTGAVVFSATYSPYGVVESSAGSFDQPFGYAGGLTDSLTGLVRFGARDYDPSVGRWVTKDPIRFDGGLNLYEYAAGAPHMYVDPNGRIVLVIAAVIGIGALINGVVNSLTEHASGRSATVGFFSGLAGGLLGGVAALVSAPLGLFGAGSVGGFVGNGATTSLNEFFSPEGFSRRSVPKILTSAACGAAFGAGFSAIAGRAATGPLVQAAVGGSAGTGIASGVATAIDELAGH